MSLNSIARQARRGAAPDAGGGLPVRTAGPGRLQCREVTAPPPVCSKLARTKMGTKGHPFLVG